MSKAIDFLVHVLLVSKEAGQVRLSRNAGLQQRDSALANQKNVFSAETGFNALMAASIRASLVAVARQHPGDLFVDVGAGEGNYAEILAGHYGCYIGLEPCDLPAFRRIPDIFRTDACVLVQYDPDHGLPVRSGTADVVWLIGSYDHVPDAERRQLVIDVDRILKPGGRMVICMTNNDSWFRRLLRRLGQAHRIPTDPEHHCLHGIRSLVAEIGAWVPGLRLEQAEANRFYLPNSARLFTLPILRSLFICRLLNGLIALVLLRSPLGSFFTVVVKKA